MNENIDILTEIRTFHNAMLEKFTPIWERAKQNIGLYGINHWTQKQKSEFQLQNRIPLNIPILTQKINSLLGFERENRSEAIYIGQGAEDELNGEILTKLREWTDNVSIPKYRYTKSEIFRDAVIPCYGALEIFEDEDLTGKKIVKTRRIPYNSVLWDWNFSDVEMATCSRLQTIRWIYVDDVIREYPDSESEALRLQEGLDNSQYQKLKDFENFYQIDGKKYLVKVITDYNKKNYVRYDLIKTNLDIPNEIAEDKYSFYTRKEAVEKKKEFEMMLCQLGITGDNFKIKTSTGMRVEKTVIAGDIILQNPEWLDDDEFPIKILFSYFFDGEFWTPVDIATNTQNIFDKVYAQIDKSMGEGVKHGKIIYPDLIHPSMPIREVESRLTKGETIYGLDPNRKPFELVQAPAFQGQYLQMLEINQQIMESVFGGKTFQGETDYAGQSGIAISQLQQAGATMTMNFLENLQRFDESVSKYIMKKIIKLYDYEMEIRILGSDFNEKVMNAIKSNPNLYQESAYQTGVGFLRINAKGNKPIYESSYDIVIKPVTARRNEKDIKFQKLIQYAQITGNQIPAKIIAKLLDFTPTETDELVSYAEEQKKLMLAEKQFAAQMQIAKQTDPAKASQGLNNIKQNQTLVSNG